MRLGLLIGLLLQCFTTTISAQIYLQNASFEGKAQDATVPVGWHPCELGTTPDILPGPWNVYQESSAGETYVGLITRDDGSWESIGQRLRRPIKSNDCYSFSIDLAHSRTYSGYNRPIRLRVWGCQTRCSKDQLLLETDLIRNLDWETFEIEFYAKKTINYIVLEAYCEGTGPKCRGNILIDNITPLKQCIRAELNGDLRLQTSDFRFDSKN